MIWLVLAALAVAAMAPLAFSLLRHASLKKRKGAALALYQAQLAELELEREQGHLTAAEYEAAQVEIKRRLLAAAETADPPVAAKGRGLVLAALAVVPAAAMALYLVGGTPCLRRSNRRRRGKKKPCSRLCGRGWLPWIPIRPVHGKASCCSATRKARGNTMRRRRMPISMR